MTIYNDQINQYIVDLFAREDDALAHIRQDSLAENLPAISIKPEEGRFLQFLVRAAGARKVIEIGTLGGYSGTWLARGLPEGARLITLEMDSRHADISRRHFDQAGVGDKVEIRLGNAHESLKKLAPEGPFDFVFIDAEKTGYNAYLDWSLENVRLGGMIAMHNAFRKGSVAGLVPDDEYSAAMRDFNRRVASEPRLLSTIYPAGDGTLISVKIA